MAKFKKTKSEKVASIGKYELRRETYEEDSKGDTKIRINEPIKIKLDKKK